MVLNEVALHLLVDFLVGHDVDMDPVFLNGVFMHHGWFTSFYNLHFLVN